MSDNKKQITGSFGGLLGGGGSRKPTRDPDTLNNTETGKVIEILSEGVTEGFATPSKKLSSELAQVNEVYELDSSNQDQYIAYAHEDIYLDDTPIRSVNTGKKGDDGSYQKANFNGFDNPTDGSFDVRHGSKNQSILSTDGTLQTENIVDDNVQKVQTEITKEVTVGRPSLESTQSLAPERVKVTLSVSQLQETNDKGDLLGRTVEFQIFFQYVGEDADASRTLMKQDSFSGRTGDQYRREYVFATESFSRDSFRRYPLEITVKRLSPLNEDNDQIQDDLFFSAITEIQRPTTDYQGQLLDTNIEIDDGNGVTQKILDGQFSYPFTAYSFLQFDAYQFASIPKRTFRYRGIKVKIPAANGGHTPTIDITGNGRIEYPSDYVFNNELTGTLFWTTDPAFILLDLLLNTRYGFGKYIKIEEIDLFSFFQASKYSAQLLTTSRGQEPRFAFNSVINKTTEAFNIIKEISGMMRCYPIWSGGKLTLVQDRPINPDDEDPCTYQTPVYIFSLANTLNGFSYSGVSLKTRHGKVVVEYFNMESRQLDTVVITNQQVFNKTHNIKKVKAFGCTSFAQAARYGRNIIWSENNETDVVTFDVSIESGVVIRPGAVVGINDPVRAGIRRAGRVSAVTLDGSGHLTALTVDDSSSTDLPTTGDRTILILDSAGKAQSATISSISGKVITLSSALAPSSNATFQANTVWLIENTVKSELYRIVDVEEQDGILYKMTGIPYNCNKYDFVDGKNRTLVSNDSLQNPTLVADNRTTSIFETDRGGPSSITGFTALRQKEGQVISVLIVSFANVLGTGKYLVKYKFKPGSISNQGTNIYGQPSLFMNPLAPFGEPLREFITEDLTFEIENASVGTYQIEVYSINAIGKVSKNPTIKQIDNFGKLAPPLSPTSLNFEFTQSGDLKLTWPLSQDVDVTSNGHVIIKHNDDTSGNAIWGNSRTIMIVHGSQTSVILPTVTGEYLIKYQDQTLIQSTNSVSVIVSSPDLVDRDLIGTIKENTTFGGAKTALTVNSSGMEINQSASNTLIDSITANIDTISDFDTLDGDTGVLEGTYQFTNVLDLGAKFSGVIFESIVRFEGFSDSTLFDSYVPAVVLNSDGVVISGGVDALTSFDGDVLENATAELQIQTSDDNSTFTTANNFIETVASARYFKFTLKLKTTTTTENSRIIIGDGSTNTLGCRVLMNKRTETSATLTSTSNTAYTFTNGFFVGTGATTGFDAPLPSVTINALALGTGEFFEVTNISGTGFNVVFKNSSGVAQTGKEFTYTASGFGKKV
jgi:predicted phage tail protein